MVKSKDPWNRFHIGQKHLTLLEQLKEEFQLQDCVPYLLVLPVMMHSHSKPMSLDFIFIQIGRGWNQQLLVG